MIHFIGGKPGGGKTLFVTVHKLIEELMTTERGVVTNISLRLDRLQEYINDNHSAPFLLEKRLRILSEEEVYTFYRYRVGLDLPENDEGLPVFAEPDRGVVYYLDEIHIFFNSRAWKKTGAGALYYLSQHRKLGDDVYCITQAISNVDKQFRSIAQDFTYITNERTQSFRGFRHGSGFVARTFLQPATGTAGEVPMEVHRFALDIKRASLYDTAGGVGIVGGNKADLGRKAKGLPLKVLYLAIPIGCAAIWAAFSGLQHVVAQDLETVAKAPAKTGGSAAVGAAPPASPGPRAASSPPTSPTPYLVGALTRGHLTVMLWSDGRRTVEPYAVAGLAGTFRLTDGRVVQLAHTATNGSSQQHPPAPAR